MSPQEWWWLYDVKRQKDPDLDYAGHLDESTVADLYEWMESQTDGDASGKPGG